MSSPLAFDTAMTKRQPPPQRRGLLIGVAVAVVAVIGVIVVMSRGGTAPVAAVPRPPAPPTTSLTVVPPAPDARIAPVVDGAPVPLSDATPTVAVTLPVVDAGSASGSGGSGSGGKKKGGTGKKPPEKSTWDRNSLFPK